MSYGGLAYLFNNPASPEVSVLFTSWREIKSAWLGEWGENLTVGTSVSEEKFLVHFIGRISTLLGQLSLMQTSSWSQKGYSDSSPQNVGDLDRSGRQ